MEDEDLSIDQLKSVYKAQTEAYLDFNLALINLLSNQKELLLKVEGLNILSLGSVNKKFIKLYLV